MAMLTTTTTTRTLISTLSMVSSKRRIGRPTIDGKMAAGKLAPAKPHLTNYTHQVDSTHTHTQPPGEDKRATQARVARTRTRENERSAYRYDSCTARPSARGSEPPIATSTTITTTTTYASAVIANDNLLRVDRHDGCVCSKRRGHERATNETMRDKSERER